MNTTPPGAPEDNDDAEGVEARAAGSSGQDSHTNNDTMEVDREGNVSTLISASTSKCKLTSDDDTTTFNHKYLSDLCSVINPELGAFKEEKCEINIFHLYIIQTAAQKGNLSSL